MQDSYKESLAKIEGLKIKLSGPGEDRLKLSQELMRLKRNLSKYPEHKEKVNKKKENHGEE